MVKSLKFKTSNITVSNLTVNIKALNRTDDLIWGKGFVETNVTEAFVS
jgi:hypothetical protein